MTEQLAPDAIVARLHKLCLRAYPAVIRRRFGADQHDAFCDGYVAARRRGKSHAAWFVLRAAAETLSLGLWERVAGGSVTAGARHPGIFEAFLRDTTFALRSLRHSPGFAFGAVLTLALGIGANTAIFSIINAVWLRPLPFPEPARIVTVWDSQPQQDILRYGASAHDFGDWQERNRVFGAMALYVTRAGNLTASTAAIEAERVQYSLITAEFLSVVGITPQIGRDLSSEDGPGADNVVVISNGLGTRRFGGASEALGREIRLDDRDLTVIGIMPEGFDFPAGTDMWKPF